MYIKKVLFMLSFSVFTMLSCTETISIAAGDYSKDYSFSGEDPNIGDIVKIEPLRNPDRGYHTESNFFAHNLTNPYHSADVYPSGFISQRENQFEAGDDGLTLLQLYIYLTEWVDKPISQAGLDNIQTLFNGVKNQGYKVILRFAYNWEGTGNATNATKERIEGHLEQLKPILDANRGLIATIQAGFIGAWGEWHSTGDQSMRNAVVNGLLNIFPTPYCIQMRYPNQKNAITGVNQSDKTRVGFANDYFTAGEHELAPGNDFVPGTTDYAQVETESPYFFMSGEIPYNENTEWGLSKTINTMNTLKILRDHHYSAFDISQNYDLNITSWKRRKVYPSILSTNKILFSEDYFKNEEGKTVARSYYEFVRDHLGYRLNLLNTTKVSGENGSLVYDIQLTNTGFATVINPKPFYLVLIDENNNVVKEIKLNDVNPRDWQPFDPTAKTYEILTHSVKGSVATGVSGTCKIGIWMPDEQNNLQYNNTYDVRWALNENLSHWSDNEGKYTVNIIGEITF